jgi:heat shock protein HslJ
MRFQRCLQLLMVLLLGGVAMVQAQPDRGLTTNQRVLTGIEWRLVSSGPAGAESPLVPGTAVTIRFAEDNRTNGSTGCNSFSGLYEVRGDSITFNRIISTRRACLDQRANQQEQRLISGLDSATRFRLTPNRLTILSDRNRNVLNFTDSSANPPDDGPRDDRTDPLTTLASYYDAINANDYRRAYRFWESPTSSFEQFVAGFADTERVRLLVDPKPRLEGAAGSNYAQISTVVVATTRAGADRVFAGCYTMRRSNVQDRGWSIYRAEISQVPSSARVSRMLSQVCRN